jgi:hypothetical protein
MSGLSALAPQTAVEAVAGHVVTQSAATIVAALAGGPLAALLPVLGMSLASERQRARVEAALVEMNSLLEENQQLVRELSDAQYKLINETILTHLQTTDTAKLNLLKIALQNALRDRSLTSPDATFLARVIRDISPAEVAFLARAFSFEAVRLVRPEQAHEQEDKVLSVSLSSKEVVCVSGLVSLGILASGGAAFIDLGQFRFMPIAAKLLAILGESQ